MKTDIEIAQSATLRPIAQLATELGIHEEQVIPYGRFKAKIPYENIDEAKVAQSKLILVTAITPTKAGIGKTTVGIALAQGLHKLGKNAILALREPSLGPCFGMKGALVAEVTPRYCRWKTLISTLRVISTPSPAPIT